LFYLRAVAPASITTGDIYRGAVPFFCLQIAAIAILWVVPELATWLPRVVYPAAQPVAAASSGGGSVLDDILGGGFGAPSPAAPSGSPLDELLDRPQGEGGGSQPQSDPLLDQLLRRN
jgi:hypothetical protein